MSKGWASRRVFASKRAQAQRREGWRSARLRRESEIRCAFCEKVIGPKDKVDGLDVLMFEPQDGSTSQFPDFSGQAVEIWTCSVACRGEVMALLEEIRRKDPSRWLPGIEVRLDA